MRVRVWEIEEGDKEEGEEKSVGGWAVGKSTPNRSGKRRGDEARNSFRLANPAKIRT